MTCVHVHSLSLDIAQHNINIYYTEYKSSVSLINNYPNIEVQRSIFQCTWKPNTTLLGKRIKMGHPQAHFLLPSEEATNVSCKRSMYPVLTP